MAHMKTAIEAKTLYRKLSVRGIKSAIALARELRSELPGLKENQIVTKIENLDPDKSGLSYGSDSNGRRVPLYIRGRVRTALGLPETDPDTQPKRRPAVDTANVRNPLKRTGADRLKEKDPEHIAKLTEGLRKLKIIK